MALLHDVLVTVGIFSLFQLDFDLSIVAALLTILGYSVNDSVVVSDRIRENLRKFKRMDLNELLNISINETLSRTILTGVTAIAGITALLIFGGEVLRNFSASPCCSASSSAPTRRSSSPRRCSATSASSATPSAVRKAKEAAPVIAPASTAGADRAKAAATAGPCRAPAKKAATPRR